MWRIIYVSVSLNNVEENTTENLKSWQEIPGPSSLPLIGQLHHFLPGGYLSKRSDLLSEKNYRKYGPIVRFQGFFGSPPVITLYDPEVISHILRSENTLPIRPGLQSLEYFRTKVLTKEGYPPDTPTGLITDQGEVWKKFRSTVNPIMLHSKIIKLYKETLKEVADDMVKRMRRIRNDKNILTEKFDMEMNLWALESIAVVALGGRLNCLDENLPDDSHAKRLIHQVHNIFILSDKLDFAPGLWRYIPTPTFNRAMKYYEEQMKTSKFFITKAMKKFKNTQKSSNDEKSVLEKLFEIDEHIAVIMATDMLFAGVDTTANTITAILYHLASNPDKQSKLREEIMSKEEKQPYLKACLKESIRLMPVVAGNMRQTSKEYNLFGYKVPKGMYIMFAHQALSVMEEYYPRSKEFIPERWIVEKGDPLYHGNTHPFAYNPFGFGVRSCIGRRIAELEIETFLTTVLENFKIEWVGPPPKIHTSTINYIKGPYNFVFKDL
ncbi:cytochrome P450 CYP12A2-like isoform X2 [Nymphalis io]|uniref:cytochrome P450 CYP12A2-like isoform X2 n=1 Tax=Inachis io TaxID=171585 RepID=UPI002167EAC8|nr:cytochrome P450 CYP12A2-like isoform X2 [Nymphalis io]